MGINDMAYALMMERSGWTCRRGRIPSGPARHEIHPFRRTVMNAVSKTISSTSRSAIWAPVTVGRMRLPHRLAMAPMTRGRAGPDGAPGPLTAEYYAQRAGFGLLISDGTQPSADGQGYLN